MASYVAASFLNVHFARSIIRATMKMTALRLSTFQNVRSARVPTTFHRPLARFAEAGVKTFASPTNLPCASAENKLPVATLATLPQFLGPIYTFQSCAEIRLCFAVILGLRGFVCRSGHRCEPRTLGVVNAK